MLPSGLVWPGGLLKQLTGTGQPEGLQLATGSERSSALRYKALDNVVLSCPSGLLIIHFHKSTLTDGCCSSIKIWSYSSLQGFL